MTLDCVVFNKYEIYRPLSFIGKLCSDYGSLSKTKFNLGTIHKGRLLKGVGRWVHQKEIYYIRLSSKNRRQG